MIVTSANYIVSTAQIGPGAVENADLADGAVDNAKVNAAAAIVDTKLAQITTASKVSGAALTSLGSIPAGGGSVPTANVAQLPALGTAPSPPRQTAIVNAEVAAAAAIVDTKLAQITTASKVSGAALTSLASVPAGAGVIPAANIPPSYPDKVAITEEQIYIQAGATRAQTGANTSIPAVRMVDSTNDIICFAIRVPDNMTAIQAIKMIYIPSVGGNNMYAGVVNVNKVPVDGSAEVADTTGISSAVAVGATAARLYEYSLPANTFDNISSVAQGDILGVKFQLDRTNADDTNTGNIDIVAFLFDFS